MYGEWVLNGVLYLIFAVLNAEAATSNRPSVHTVLIRVAISWGTALSVLFEFDQLPQLPGHLDNIEGRGNRASDTLKYTTKYLKHPQMHYELSKAI